MKNVLLLIALCLFLNACHSGGGNVSLTPLPPEKRDPQDSVLISSINNFIAQKDAPANSLYDFVRVDLNDDELRDGLVLFKTPYSYWCGWAGCHMAVFKAEDNDFSFISDMRNIRGPIYIAPSRTNNYRDIIVRLSGANIRDKNVILKYNGNTYPENPIIAPELTAPITKTSYEAHFL